MAIRFGSDPAGAVLEYGFLLEENEVRVGNKPSEFPNGLLSSSMNSFLSFCVGANIVGVDSGSPCICSHS